MTQKITIVGTVVGLGVPHNLIEGTAKLPLLDWISKGKS